MPEELIGLDAARARVAARARPLCDRAAVPLAAAQGRVLADAVRAAGDVPAFDNSAMDGFAVRAADVAAAPVVLPLAGEARAGRPADGPLPAGAAMRISTGALVPDGADAVVPLESAVARGGEVELRAAVPVGRHVRRAGEDVRAGTEVLTAGMRLGPAELGVLAAVGVAAAPCLRRPRVAVVTTGDELVAPDAPLPAGGVRDANAFTVPAQARAAGAEVVSVEHAADDPAATADALRAALEDADVVVVCGGVSVGEHDHVRPALAELGVEEEFWGVALRPGKPTWFGARGETLVFGLPGNPVSAMVTFALFVRPALLALAGEPPDARRQVPATLDEDYAKAPGRAHALRARLEPRADGWHARLTRAAQGSHVLTSMLGADALVVLEADRGDVRAGERVVAEPLA